MSPGNQTVEQISELHFLNKQSFSLTKVIDKTMRNRCGNVSHINNYNHKNHWTVLFQTSMRPFRCPIGIRPVEEQYTDK